MSKLVDLTRQRFGKLSVIERVENLYGAPAWRCKCDCGNEKVIGGGNLRNGYTTSCGCQRLGKRVINLVGQKFGKLTVIKALERKVTLQLGAASVIAKRR